MPKIQRLAQLMILTILLGLTGRQGPTLAQTPLSDGYPVCTQPPLTGPVGLAETPSSDYQVYLPLIVKAPPAPPCTVYCGLLPVDDPYRPAGLQIYFADEFDCDQLLDYWTIQGPMTAASYQPPVSGYVTVSNGTLKIGVPGDDVSFPYLYLVDDSATTYDVPHTTRRVDWLPDADRFRVAVRVRFNVDELGEHRVAIYADGHRPNFGGPLFYVGTDYNADYEAWRGLIVGADRGHNFVDLGDYGLSDPYTDWVVVTVDYDFNADLFSLAVNGTPVISQLISTFKGYPQAATRPDILYLGSLAILEEAVPWTDIEVDWLRVYAPATGPEATFGLLQATVETPPTPADLPTGYSEALPPGPFANTPHWSEDFAPLNEMPPDWTLVLYPDPANAWTTVENSYAKLLNNGWAAGVPVWAVFDDMLPVEILAAGPGDGRETPAEYLRRRGGSPFIPDADDLSSAAIYPRTDWRPNSGNIRFAWRGFQSANGYGVEISNGGHGDGGSSIYFTGAMFYTLIDTTTAGGGQFIFPSCQEQYFWRLHRLPDFPVQNTTAIVTADYINGTVHLYVNGQKIGWWPESDCSLNWYLKGENATSPEVLFFGNPATAWSAPGPWSEVHVDWFATFAGLPRQPVTLAQPAAQGR